ECGLRRIGGHACLVVAPAAGIRLIPREVMNADDRPLRHQSASDLAETERTVRPAAQGRIVPGEGIPVEHLDKQLSDRRDPARLGKVCNFASYRIDVQPTIDQVAQLGAVVTRWFASEQV